MKNNGVIQNERASEPAYIAAGEDGRRYAEFGSGVAQGSSAS
jgi:hypothetical protein